jgi:hypothetical protein
MAIASLTTWNTNDVLTSTALNTNFATIRDHYNANAVEIVGNQTIAGTKTFSAASVFSLGLTVSASGITVTGNSTITGTLASLTGITSSGTAALAVITASSTLNVTGTSTLGVTNTAALTSTTFAPTGLAQGPIAALTRYSGGDAGATPAINWNNGNKQRFRLTANATPTFANPVKGADYVLELQQDGTGSRTVTWSGATVVWPDGVTPTLTTTANRKDVILLECVDAASSGTYLGFVMGQNFANTTS